MKYPGNFTILGYYFNSLVDSGEILDLEETHKIIKRKSLFPWLKHKFEDRVDISLYSEKEINEIEEFFASLSSAVDEEKKMGICKNGLCLLVAYCFEGVQQRDVTDFQ